MLPSPASYAHRGPYTRQRGNVSLWDNWSLRGRSRATNLAVYLLCGLCILSLLLNIRYWAIFPSDFSIFTLRHPRQPYSIQATLSRDYEIRNLDHLIVVAGHAIWEGCTAENRLKEVDWVLESSQKDSKSVGLFFKHIAKGAAMALEDPRSLLVFSGGQTRTMSLTTEAQSYLRLAHEAKLLTNSSGLFPRATTENFALDSFQNVLYSIARFHEVTGSYPEHITVIGFGMKRRRFEDLHARALRWPLSQFAYVGVDVESETKQMIDGEHKFGYIPYSQDLYGCHGELLEKRRRRNPFHRFHSYYTSAPELISLLDWCPSAAEGQTKLFNGPLPWDRRERP